MRIIIKRFLQTTLNSFLIAIALTTVGINLFLLTDAVMALTSTVWIPVRARVTDSAGFISRARTRPYVNIRYEYYLDGERFLGEKVCFLELPAGCSQQVLDETAKLRSGDTVTAHAMPILPQYAVLFRETTANAWSAFLVSLPLIWLGSLILFYPGWAILMKWIKARKLIGTGQDDV